jgi:hypothetical protein
MVAGEGVVVDKTSLHVIGAVFGALTLAVALVAALLVSRTVAGHIVLDPPGLAVSLPAGLR